MNASNTNTKIVLMNNTINKHHSFMVRYDGFYISSPVYGSYYDSIISLKDMIKKLQLELEPESFDTYQYYNNDKMHRNIMLADVFREVEL